MDYSKKTREALISLCKEKGLKGYSGKKKDALLHMLSEQKDDDNDAPPSSSDQKQDHSPPEHKKNLGQYFTVDDTLQQFIFDNVLHKSTLLLEPSFGAGHLLKKFKEYDDNYPMLCYELDATVKPVVSFNAHQTALYSDFTQHTPPRSFKTIIGNPPYVKQKKGNLYLKFIELCFHLLDPDGELLFIVPSDFIKLTSASALIDNMTRSGSFTHFLFPHNEKLFDGASIDVVAFRYQKGVKSNTARVNGKEVFCHVNQGVITFTDNDVTGISVDSLFHVYVGLVSGRDKIFRVPFGNVTILNDKDKQSTYIFVDSFPTQHPDMDAHLLQHKDQLIQRKIKQFSEEDWFKWGAPRNITSIRQHIDKSCIYVRNMTRNKEVAFIGKVQYFGGTLLCLLPKKDMTPLEMSRVIQYMNSPRFQENYLYAGRFKIGHKQVSVANLPL